MIGDFEIIVSIDESDPHNAAYRELYAKNPKARIISNNNKSAVEAINNAAKVCQGEIMIVVSDDTGCFNGWDKAIEGAIGSHTDFVLKVFDGIQDWLCTMPVIDRVYYNRFGYIYHPDYKHLFCDTEFTHVADILKKMLWRNDILIKHMHYSITKERRDELQIRNDNTWNEGKSLYISRLKRNFGLQNVDIWDIKSRSHIQWLRTALNV